MSLDYGDKTVGVAVSDPLGITAQGLDTIVRERAGKLRRTYAELERLIREYEVEKVILGYPLGLDGIEGERCAAVRSFKEGLERRTGLEVELFDERLTTAESERLLDAAGVRDKKQHTDRMAAVLILQAYMACNS